MNDDEPTEQERAEAEALARALEKDGAAEAAPVDALETAALLRHDELSDLAARRVLERVSERRAPDAKPRASRWRVFLAMSSLAAVLALMAGSTLLRLSRAVSPAALPRPGAQLLAAQAHAVNDAAGLELAMRDYRGTLYGALAARYRR